MVGKAAGTIRHDSKQLLDDLRAYGVKPKIISGDNLKTAKTIAQQLGFQDKCVSINDEGKPLVMLID